MLAVTGHRPERIAAAIGLRSLTRDNGDHLIRFATRKIIREDPARVGIGMARGWDMACAVACVNLSIPFIAYTPFAGQERSWMGSDQLLYRALLDKAAEVKVVCNHSLNIAYLTRNEAMIDAADRLLAFYSGAPGGTAHAVGYAESWRKPVNNVWDEWARIVGAGADGYDNDA